MIIEYKQNDHPFGDWMPVRPGDNFNEIDFRFYKLRIGDKLILNYSKENEELYNQAIAWQILQGEI